MVERLEERRVPTIDFYVKNGSLVITADNLGDNVSVEPSLGRVELTGKDGPSDYIHVLANIPAAQVQRIFFTGGTGNDSFVNETKLPATARGGKGDDYLWEPWQVGGIGDGGPGTDTVHGFNVAFGGIPEPGVTGAETVEGQVTLLSAGQSYVGWSAANLQALADGKLPSASYLHRAYLVLQNGGPTPADAWTAEDVARVEDALTLLLARVPNAALINGPPVPGMRPVLVKVASLPPQKAGSEITLGLHRANGMIYLASQAFTTATLADLTVIHEFAHHWNTISRGEVLPFGAGAGTAVLHATGTTWPTLSHWSRTPLAGLRFNGGFKGNWWYDPRAGFGRLPYGRSNPMEDWATAWESYFYYRYPVGTVAGLGLRPLPAGKTHYLDTFFSLLGRS